MHPPERKVQEEAQTAEVWRAWLPGRKDARAFFDAAPIETAETLETDGVGELDAQIDVAGRDRLVPRR